MPTHELKRQIFSWWERPHLLILWIIVLFVLVGPGVLIPKKKAIQALEAEGYHDIKIDDKSWFLIALRDGGKGDWARFKASAVDLRGKRVGLRVYTGFIKPSTVVTN